MGKATVREFVDAYKQYDPTRDYYHRYVDEAISLIVEKYPGHKSREQVFAKITLVNRVYRANIERRRKEAEWKLSKFLIDNKFDNTISPLKKIRTFDSGAVPEIVGVHSQFVSIAKKVLRVRAVSFCSKYLHFHFPKIIPIFDSKSYDTAWTLVGEEIDTNRDGVGDYEYFCLALLALTEKLKRLQGFRNANLKAIDYLLYEELRR